ncbi:MAG: hypothetical protein HY054_03270 [Proteobacteria bacterium]|nr:hypothetical protein [Pseudomonadota bacterium]
MKRWAARARYAFDLSMASGPLSMIGWLALVSLIVIVIAAIVLTTTHIAPPDNHDGLSFIEAFWEATMRTIDAGNVGGDSGWAFRVIMLAVTIWGIFVVSSLIGLMSAGVQSQLDILRKGRSFVLERRHTVILNWSNSIFDIIKELAIAHERDRTFSIVILANKDKVEMEDEIAAKVGTHRARIVCRSGDPGDLADLEIVNLETARSIIVLSSDSDDADAQNIKIVLALVHGPERRAARYQISAEFRAAKCAEIARDIGNGEVQAVVPDDLISRVIVHSSRHAGLSAVYSELLDFEGNEFYAVPEPSLTGKTFGEALSLVNPGALIGLCDESSAVRLNPEMDTVIADKTLAVIVANDRDSIAIGAAQQPLLDETALRARSDAKEIVERALILGWNRRGPAITQELSFYMAAGSEISIAAATPNFEQEVSQLQSLKPGVSLKHTSTDTRDRHALEALGAANYDRIIVLACSDNLASQAADTQTLVTLLHLREIAAASGKRGILVSEMTDIRNRQLAAITRADDFVVSDRLVSLMLAQASESEFTSAIFKDLLDEEGSEIYMRPIDGVVSTERPVDFYTIIEACRRRGETAFGYCRPRGDKANPSGVKLNPDKSETLSYKTGDYIVVLARG